GATEDIIGRALLKSGLSEKLLTQWNDDDLLAFTKLLRMETKPMIIAANKMDIPTATPNLERIRKEFPHLIIVPCSAESELALKEADKHKIIRYTPGETSFEVVGKLSEKQTQALDYIKSNVLDKWKGTGIQTAIDAAVFELLKYIAIFPGGVNNLTDSQGRVLPDCFLMRPGTTALDFAFKLHSDFGNNFIRAIDVKTRKTVGKEHALKHRDVVEIISGK
ncbi:MAG: TGS domain-containing protein, partial [Nanoarchaeota archaeon]